MQFTYEPGTIFECLTIKTNQHVDIMVVFEHGDALAIQADGYEFNLTEDVVNGLFVGIGDKMYTLADVAREASIQYPDFKAEADQETAENEGMERYLSSPYSTGRV